MLQTLLPLVCTVLLKGGVAINNGGCSAQAPIVLQRQIPHMAPAPKKGPPESGMVYVPMHISAIGFAFDPDTNRITYIDPASSLYGKVYQGDIALTIDGLSMEQSQARLNHFGNAMTAVTVGIMRRGKVMYFKCKRIPIERFAPTISAGLWGQLRP